MKNSIAINWYFVKLVFNIDIDFGQSNTQFDEQWRTIEATSEEEALFKAEKLAAEEEENFTNHKSNHVMWKFIGITEIHLLSDLTERGKISSFTHEKPEPAAYIRYIKNKFAFLKDKSGVFV